MCVVHDLKGDRVRVVFFLGGCVYVVFYVVAWFVMYCVILYGVCYVLAVVVFCVCVLLLCVWWCFC